MFMFDLPGFVELMTLNLQFYLFFSEVKVPKDKIKAVPAKTGMTHFKFFNICVITKESNNLYTS